VFENCIIETIKNIEISDKEKYIEIIKTKYTKNRLKLAFFFVDTLLLNECYVLLKKRHALSMVDIFLFYSYKMMFIANIMRQLIKRIYKVED